ncbi:glycosyltransferase family 2 protein [Kocuria rhizophila]|uniref:glycosyltransferase family 2 protein n=1 Tax=Kocuria rhizophila TaxID=72000 RepID=UPI0022F1155F|nr:glycosyltransferase family 2 protein [Kocuria rhizophila]MDA4827509.1 glycosyltransferase family 2 protein [Kocuria rhizophila]
MGDVLARMASRKDLALKRVRRSAEAAARDHSRSRRRVFREVRDAVRLVPHPGRDVPARGGVWAVAVVHNEMDVLPLVLDHLERQGVTGLVVCDNASTDGTRQFLEEYHGDLELVLAADELPHRLQEHKLDVLVRQAVERGAQWIVPFDADEFWYGLGGTLAEVLQRAAPDRPVQSAHVHNAVRTPEGFLVGTGPDPLPKVAFRPHRWAHLAHGNHSVHRPGLIGQDLRVLHFPYRSQEHFLAKIRHGSRALGQNREGAPVGHSWSDLDLLSDEELRAVYADMLVGRGPWYMDWIPRGPMAPLTEFPPATWPLD